MSRGHECPNPDHCGVCEQRIAEAEFARDYDTVDDREADRRADAEFAGRWS